MAEQRHIIDIQGKSIINGIPMSEESKALVERIRKVKLKKVKIKVQAVADAYYSPIEDHNQARIVKAGEVITFSGNLKNGRLPLWARPVDIKEAKKLGIEGLEEEIPEEDNLDEDEDEDEGKSKLI